MKRFYCRIDCGRSKRTQFHPLMLLAAASLTVSLATLSTSANAAIIDLTTAGTSGTINSAIYEQTNPQSTGTGTIDSFEQQSPQGNGTSSKAYNTTENNVLDNQAPNNFNHSIFLSAVPIVFRGNTLYREFLLDTNENSGGGSEFLSLDEVQVFVGGTANSNVTTFSSGVLNHDGTLVYRMDAGTDSWVALNYALNNGSGSGDMYLLVPAAAFTGFLGSDVVTLYSQFGLQGVNPSGFTGDFGSSDGFEEWALREGVAIPEPSTIALAILGIVAVVSVHRTSRRS